MPSKFLLAVPVVFVFYLIFYSQHFGSHLWVATVFSALAAALLARFLLGYLRVRPAFRLASWVGIWMVLTVAMIEIYADVVRSAKLAAFGADVAFQHSFLSSLLEAPRDFQFFLHAAAMKNCEPYAWSYRTMSFYQLPPNVAVNVLPEEWIERCQIERQ